MKVKVILGEDIRVWRYSVNSKFNVSSLREFVVNSFDLNHFSLQYEDEEQDHITLSANTDLNDAFDCANREKRKSLKIYIEAAQKSSSSPKANFMNGYFGLE